jgi:hypothetical protein
MQSPISVSTPGKLPIRVLMPALFQICDEARDFLGIQSSLASVDRKPEANYSIATVTEFH